MTDDPRALLRWRKKPVVIEAMQYIGHGNFHARYRGQVADWVWEALEDRTLQFLYGSAPLGHNRGMHDHLLVRTKEGELTVSPGDWIIRGVAGELYPCKPDIFEATYEPANSHD